MKEKPIRSIIKAISWRLGGAFFSAIISLVITGKIEYALSIAGLDLVLKIGMYYLHERVWNNVKFGLETKLPKEDSV